MPMFDQAGRWMLTKLGLRLAHVQMLAESSLHSANIGVQISPKTQKVGRVSLSEANSVGQLRNSPGSPGVTFWDAWRATRRQRSRARGEQFSSTFTQRVSFCFQGRRHGNPPGHITRLRPASLSRTEPGCIWGGSGERGSFETRRASIGIFGAVVPFSRFRDWSRRRCCGRRPGSPEDRGGARLSDQKRSGKKKSSPQIRALSADVRASLLLLELGAGVGKSPTLGILWRAT